MSRFSYFIALVLSFFASASAFMGPGELLVE